MPLLDLLKKKDRTAGNDAHSPRADPEAGPVFTFMRSVRLLLHTAYQLIPYCYNMANMTQGYKYTRSNITTNFLFFGIIPATLGVSEQTE